MKKVMEIQGMSCDHCKNRVEGALNDIPGVKAKVNLGKKEAVVSVEESVSDDTLRSAVTEAGYEVTGIQEKKGLFS